MRFIRREVYFSILTDPMSWNVPWRPRLIIAFIINWLKNLKILMIGSDRKLFDEGSAVSQRIKEYGNLVVELHIIVFATRKHLRLLKIENSKLKISNNVWVYPTNSFSRWFYLRDAVTLSKKIVYENKFIRGKSVITTQDPFECGWTGLKIKKWWRLPLEVQLHTDPFSPYFTGFQNRVRQNNRFSPDKFIFI